MRTSTGTHVQRLIQLSNVFVLRVVQTAIQMELEWVPVARSSKDSLQLAQLHDK